MAEFLFGTGFAIAEGDIWKGRRRAVVRGEGAARKNATGLAAQGIRN